MLICDKCGKKMRGIGYAVEIPYTVRYLCTNRKRVAYRRICWNCHQELDKLLESTKMNFFKDVDI